MQHGHVITQLGGGKGLADVDATWARADTTWGEGLAEVDATWARADTTCGAGLAEVDATGDVVLAQASCFQTYTSLQINARHIVFQTLAKYTQ